MNAWEKVLVCLLALAIGMPLPLLAQPPGTVTPFRPEELEQIAAPIALYPDPLLAQVLMAATYPLEVVMAARFVQANPTLQGEPLHTALEARNWDDSVKSLVTFPQVLRMMSDQLEWTQKLGDAFLAQREELMDAIQRLRALAQAQGTLTSTPQQAVTVEPAPGQPVILVEPAAPDVIYVPTYDPSVVFGPWPYPAYPPYYYYPPGWLVPGAFFTFGVGIAVGTALWGAFDWHRHRVDIDVRRYHRFSEAVNGKGRAGTLERERPAPRDTGRLAWEHEPLHRRGVNYRDESTQRRFGWVQVPGAAARESFRGRVEPERPGIGLGGPGQIRPGIPVGPRPETGRSQPGGPPRGEGGRPAGPGVVQPREPGAFQGIGRGPEVRSYSSRGFESRQHIVPPSAGIRSRPPQSAPGGAVRGGGAPGGTRRR